MTGYFARLAARTGIGGDGTPPAREAAPSPFVTEETVSFVTQPERPAALAILASPPVARPESTPTQPSPAATPSDAVTRSGPPEPAPLLKRSPEPIPPRRVTAVRPAADDRPAIDAIAPAAMPMFPDPERPRPAKDDAAAAETRIGRTVIAVPPAPAALTPRVTDPPAPPAFEPPPPVETAEAAPAPDPALVERVVETAMPGPRGQAPASLPAREEPPRFAAPREPALPRQPNGPVRPRPSVAPSVRIGSIQVDVHAAPKPPSLTPPPQPTPPAPPSSRTP